MRTSRAGFTAVNASTAVYNAASEICRRSGGLKKEDNRLSPALGVLGSEPLYKKFQ